MIRFCPRFREQCCSEYRRMAARGQPGAGRVRSESRAGLRVNRGGNVYNAAGSVSNPLAALGVCGTRRQKRLRNMGASQRCAVVVRAVDETLCGSID
jgi:hypothetical protein